MRCALVACAAAIAFAAPASARSQDGTLATIRVPNNGQPAIVVRGEAFVVRAHAEADLFLGDGETLIDLPETWRPSPGGFFEATVIVPPDFDPGLYSVVADKDGVEDIQRRAVLVLDAAPKQYTLAHVASPAMHNGIEASLAGAFPEEAPLAVIVTGNLTANGAPDDFRTLLDWLNSASVPTFVAPGPRDATQGRYGDYFDPAPHMTWCGDDAVLTIGETVPGVEEFGEAGAYQRIRRAMKPARWSIGLSGFSHTALNPRLQIVLFVDTPLHALIAGRADQTDLGIGEVVWDSFQGPTKILAPAKGAPPRIQWIHVAPAGVGVVEPNVGGEP